MKRMNMSSLFAGAFALSISGIVCANAQQPNPATTTETPAPAAPRCNALCSGARRRANAACRHRRLPPSCKRRRRQRP